MLQQQKSTDKLSLLLLVFIYIWFLKTILQHVNQQLTDYM